MSWLDHGRNEELQGSLTRACVEAQNRTRSGDSFSCSRPSGKRPYVIHVLPLTTAEDPSEARVLVMIIDPAQVAEPPKILIRRLFGLSNAEADVALRVVRGDGLKPISADLALSIATIKTHMHHIFDKTDTHRQAELRPPSSSSLPTPSLSRLTPTSRPPPSRTAVNPRISSPESPKRTVVNPAPAPAR
jgi:DNA-binding CsgD family transcriptional regulator